MNRDKFVITRVYINLIDAVNYKSTDGVDPTSHFNICSIQLPNYIENVVFIELLNAQPATFGGRDFFLNTMIQIQGWGDFTSSSGFVYWRFVDETANNRLVDIRNCILRQPTRLRKLDLQFYEPNGKDKYFSAVGGFEIEIYSLRNE